MEEKKYEYVLGVNRLGDYQILEHTLNPRPHEFDAGVVFYVNDWCMGDGDGHPAWYDQNLHETIPESVYETAIKLFRETDEKMDGLTDKTEELDRDFKVGDYLYCGGFFFYIEDISNLTGKYWIKYFYSDGWGISCVDDTETYQNLEDWFKDWDIEERGEFKVITKEIYDKALNIAKSGILEVKDYLKSILTRR